jgi:hypothetical protein
MDKYCCFRGHGKVLMAKWDDFVNGRANLVEVGNTTNVDLNVTYKEVGKVVDTQSKGGGDSCGKKEIDTVSLSTGLLCFKEMNIVNALYGDLAVKAANLTNSEEYVAYKNGVIGVKNLPAKNPNFVVKGVGLNSGTIYALNADYTIDEYSLGVKITENSSIPDPVITNNIGAPNITIEYASRQESVIGMASSIPLPMYIEIHGANMAAEKDGIEDFRTRFYKVSISPAKLISFITSSTDSSVMELESTLGKDDILKARFGSSTNMGTWHIARE